MNTQTASKLKSKFSFFVVFLVLQLLPAHALVLNKSDAINIAINFVKYESDLGKKNWSEPTSLTFLDIKNIKNQTVAYEVGVFSKKTGKPLGYVNIPTEEGNGVVSTFFHQGYAPSKEIDDLFEKRWKKQISAAGLNIEHNVVIGSPSGAFGMAVKTSQPNKYLKNAQKVAGYHVFTIRPVPNLNAALGVYQSDNSGFRVANNADVPEVNQYQPSHSEESRQLAKEKNLRAKFINGVPKATVTKSAHIEVMGANRSSYPYNGSHPVSSGSDDPPYHLSMGFAQEKRRWLSNIGGRPISKVGPAGCTPVAAAIVLEWWNRKGYRNMIGSQNVNYKNNYKHPDVRNMIQKLRYEMYTSYKGGTKVRRTSRGIKKYLESRNYGYFKVSTQRGTDQNVPAWNMLTQEISQGRPVIAHIRTKEMINKIHHSNHSVVAYSYKEVQGGMDEICYATGWGNTLNRKFECGDRRQHYSTTSVRSR